MVGVLRCRGSVAFAMTVSGSLVQVNGRQRSFQALMNRSMAPMRSATAGELPRGSACRGVIEKKASTRVSHEPEGGGKWRGRSACGVMIEKTAATRFSHERGGGVKCS